MKIYVIIVIQEKKTYVFCEIVWNIDKKNIKLFRDKVLYWKEVAKKFSYHK